MPEPVRNRFLTPAMLRLLKAMRDGADKYCIAEGIQVWVDYDKFSRRTLYALLQLCLITPESCNKEGQSEVFYLNEEGRQIIDDPNYVPLIVQHFRGKNETQTV